MNKKRIPRVLMTAVRTRKPLWLVPLLLGLCALASSFLFGSRTTNKYAELLMSLGGWHLTLAGILFAGNQAARIALADSFSKLYEEESSMEQYQAKQLIYRFGRAVCSEKNRYRAARELIETYSEEDRTKIHEARRRLRHFWLLAEAYHGSGLMTPSEVFAVAGSPQEILLSLEPLEVLAAEQVEFPMKRCPWSTIDLLNEWYKLNNSGEKIEKCLPFDEELYFESIPNKLKQD